MTRPPFCLGKPMHKWKVTSIAPPGRRSVTVATEEGAVSLEVPPVLAGRRLSSGQTAFFPSSIWANFMQTAKLYQKAGILRIEKVCTHNNEPSSCRECHTVERQGTDPFFGRLPSKVLNRLGGSR